jgi:hypothetical protein
MRTLIWLSLIVLCSCQNGEVGDKPEALPELTPQAAKQAIAAFIAAHPGAFVSPGRAESAEDIRNVKVNPNAKGAMAIGMFHVDLQQKTYQLMHGYGTPGEGWFEDWRWTGSFVLREGKYELSEPEFIKAWGE